MKTRLPISIQTFRTMREGGYRYVDKTPWVRRMVDEGSHYFLSRPRRFGKSLFLDTLHELFAGSKRLFDGLHIHRNWNWSKPRAVVRLDFAKGSFRTPDLLFASAMARLDEVERATGVTSAKDTAHERLAELFEFLHDKTKHRVVVLVDEYDKPILDMLETPELARANRDFLRDLYGTIKGSDQHIRFVFLTGVSRFSTVSPFSGLNNLRDISLDPDYSAVCGYTEADLDETFGEEMAGLDRDLVREWYNGYNWLGEERLYNPYTLLLLLQTRRFRTWWYESGTPMFLLETLARRGVPSSALDGMTMRPDRMSAFDIDRISHQALMLQTGYLTIRGVEDDDGEEVLRLGYPNREVRLSLHRSVAEYLSGGASEEEANRGRLRPLLAAADFDGLERQLRTLFAGNPYQSHTKNEIARYEGFYVSMVYSYFQGERLDVTAEESSNAGRLDMAVRHAGQVFLFELKVDPPERGTALAQLEARGYAEKYVHLDEPVHLIGAEFGSKERNLVHFEAKSL